jgi:hypothetical protein
MKLTCKICKKIWTKDCPIRVWGRNEGNNLRLDCNTYPEKDFCSRLEVNFECLTIDHPNETEKK